MEASDFFTKYPAVKECFASPDGELHFNLVDADLHSRMRNLDGQSRRIVSGLDPTTDISINKSSKKS